jgi:hypothetical protein
MLKTAKEVEAKIKEGAPGRWAVGTGAPTSRLPKSPSGSPHHGYCVIIEILGSLPREAGSPYVFPGAREGRPLSTWRCS